MAKIPARVERIIKKYIEELAMELPIHRVILFGSYAKGKYKPSKSDVDLAVFSDAFKGKRWVKVNTFLLSKTHKYPIDISPLGFTTEDFRNKDKNDFIAAIKRDGIVVK